LIVPDNLEHFLWRLMTAAPFQSHGYGLKAVERLNEFVKVLLDAKEPRVGCGGGEVYPEGFHQTHGFDYTSEIEWSALVLRLPL
jgi:hypothetical protein